MTSDTVRPSDHETSRFRIRVGSGHEVRRVLVGSRSSVGYDSNQPAAVLAPAGNPPKPELTPAPVADTDVAVTEPLLAFVPCTTTVSPTTSDPRLDLAFLVTVADGPTVTFTSLPLEFVT
jgi:hypothetical protein